MTTKEKIEVMKAYDEGKMIQYREKDGEIWVDWVWKSSEPSWDWFHQEYRIKQYRPYVDTLEMIEDFKKRFNIKVPLDAMPIVRVKHKTLKDKNFVPESSDESTILLVSIWNMEELFDNYTYLDGSPCGKKENE